MHEISFVPMNQPSFSKKIVAAATKALLPTRDSHKGLLLLNQRNRVASASPLERRKSPSPRKAESNLQHPTVSKENSLFPHGKMTQSADTPKGVSTQEINRIQ